MYTSYQQLPSKSVALSRARSTSRRRTTPGTCNANLQQVAFKIHIYCPQKQLRGSFSFLLLPFSSLAHHFPSLPPPSEIPSNRRVFSTDSGYSDKSSPEISRPLGPRITPEIRYKFIRGYYAARIELRSVLPRRSSGLS